MRITRKRLENRAQHLAELLGRPWGHYQKTENGYKAVMGAWGIDYNAAYNGYEIQEISSEGGGVTVVTPGRMGAREFDAWLSGALTALRLSGEG